MTEDELKRLAGGKPIFHKIDMEIADRAGRLRTEAHEREMKRIRDRMDHENRMHDMRQQDFMNKLIAAIFILIMVIGGCTAGMQ